MNALSQAFQAAAPDTNALRAHFNEAHAAMGKAHGVMLAAAAQAKAVLTDAQRQRVEAWANAMQQRAPAMSVSSLIHGRFIARLLGVRGRRRCQCEIDESRQPHVHRMGSLGIKAQKSGGLSLARFDDEADSLEIQRGFTRAGWCRGTRRCRPREVNSMFGVIKGPVIMVRAAL
jgi:hypothetical protein